MSEKESKTMTNQIMAADKSRLKNLLGSLSKKDMLAVEMPLRHALLSRYRKPLFYLYPVSSSIYFHNLVT